MKFSCTLLVALCTLMLRSTLAADRPEVTTPPPNEIISKLKPGHPRLFLSAEDFSTLRSQTKTHPPLASNWAKSVEGGQKIIAEEPSTYEIPDGKRLLATSRRVLDRVSRLAVLYQIEGDAAYLDRAWAELSTAAQFPDWNPKHFLDTAEMTTAFAIGYDWLYAAWSEEQRAVLRDALLRHGLRVALEAYRTGKEGWWIKVGHNWNQVCNGGIGVGALALADVEPELCGELLHNVIRYLPLAMQHFAPDGAWNEGPGYWGYATKYNVFILAALDSALGTDFGLSRIPGFSETGDFPPYFTGPTGRTFNYADASDKSSGASQMFWLASKFSNEGWAAWQGEWIENKAGSPFDYVWGARWWANPDGTAKPPPELGALPLGRYFRGAEVVTMRSDWRDKDHIFLGFKAGDNQANHSNLDLGSFVLDALGERWVVDLGGDDYNLPGYFGRERWTYYRLRAEGHNTLVLNPSLAPGQDPKAFARITAFEHNEKVAYAVADLTPAYLPDAKRVTRRVSLLGGKQVMIEDEVATDAPARLLWFLHTPAAIAISDDGRSAILSIGTKSLSVRVLEPAGPTFTASAASPLPSSPRPEGQNENPGITRLALDMKDITNIKLRVLLVPQSGTLTKTEAEH